MANGDPESLHGLTRQCSAAGIHDGSGHNYGQSETECFECLVDGEKRRLAVERIEHGLDEQDVNSTLSQAEHLFTVAICHLVEVDVAKPGVAHVR